MLQSFLKKLKTNLQHFKELYGRMRVWDSTKQSNFYELQFQKYITDAAHSVSNISIIKIFNHASQLSECRYCKLH